MYKPINKIDIDLINQDVLDFSIKVEILNDNETILDVLDNMIRSGSVSIDSTSRIRRNFSSTIYPTEKNINIAKDSIVWLNKKLKLSIGIKDQRTDVVTWYEQGYFLYNSASSSYSTTDNSLNISCSDYMSKLDGTKNGQIGGSLLITIPAYDAGGNPTVIRDAAIKVISQLGGITKYSVDDIGEYKGIEEYNKGFSNYREDNPLWNKIPYDLEFSGATTVLSILEQIVTLYPNYDMYFDTSGNLIIEMIPSGKNDQISLYSSQIKEIFISESVETDMASVKNICEVWGKSFDVDRYASTSSFSGINYNVTLQGYTSYQNGDIIGFRASAKNVKNSTFSVNSLYGVLIYNDDNDVVINAGDILAGEDYVLKYKKTRVNGVYVEKFCLLGQYQVHAIDVLTDGTVIVGGYVHTDGTVLDKYSKEYFKKKYNCENVNLTVIKESPYTVQQLGEVIDVKSGDNYDNATSNSAAMAWAVRDNWINSRLTDSVSITTRLCPVLAENMKVEYIRENYDYTEEFLIKSISHDFEAGTSSVGLMKYYPLYQ